MDVTTISTRATGAIHLWLFPRFQDPTLNRSPCRQRRKIGMANARYSPTTPIETTAKNATGVGTSAPLAGTRFLLSVDHSFQPGTARSRLNANSIREELVMQAIEQKN